MPLTTVSPGLLDSNAQYTGFKNRLINGQMQIDQRNAGASVTPTTTSFGLDRWNIDISQASKISMQQNAGSVTPPAGFTNYLGYTSLAATSVGSSDYYMTSQAIEGYNMADLGWGTANAKSVTLSFWVRSSLTGTFGGCLENQSPHNRNYIFSYTISSANTWEYKTITIAGDTGTTWNSTNGAGIYLRFSMGCGSTRQGTAGSWGTTRYFTTTGETQVAATNGATFYITGVQLEKGSTATSFDYRPYGTELALCQRYYYKTTASGQNGNYTNFCVGNAYGNNTINCMLQLPVSMRTYPTTLDTSAMATFIYETGSSSGNTPTSIAINANANQNQLAYFDVNKTGAFTNAAMYKILANNNTSAYLGFGAEL